MSHFFPVIIINVMIFSRELALASLKNGSKDILVATDVAGRGIDIKYVLSLYSICSQYILYAVSIFYMQSVYSMCSQYILYAVSIFYVQSVYSVCSQYILCAVSIFYVQSLYSMCSH
jgi:hypothetical protein